MYQFGLLILGAKREFPAYGPRDSRLSAHLQEERRIL